MGAPLILHATTVAAEGRGILILGRAGAGKSGLALRLIALGAALVADDRTILSRQGGQLIAACPPAIAGLIEARGIGILRAPASGPCPLALAVDLDQTEDARLPQPRSIALLDHALPLLRKVDSDSFPAALLLHVRYGSTACDN